MSLTKQDIDALVDGLKGEIIRSQPHPGDTLTEHAPMVGCYRPRDLKRAFYLLSGLTASGERKPERVRCWLWQQHSKCDRIILVEPNCRLAGVDECFTPGTFVPDEA